MVTIVEIVIDPIIVVDLIIRIVITSYFSLDLFHHLHCQKLLILLQ